MALQRRENRAAGESRESQKADCLTPAATTKRQVHFLKLSLSNVLFDHRINHWVLSVNSNLHQHT